MRIEYIVVSLVIMVVVLLALSLFSSSIVPGAKEGIVNLLKMIGIKV